MDKLRSFLKNNHARRSSFDLFKTLIIIASIVQYAQAQCEFECKFRCVVFGTPSGDESCL